MGLNIKSERTVALVRELARRTDTNLTAAIEDAVARRLADLDHENHARATARQSAADEILRELGRLMTKKEKRAVRKRDAEMYDEAGLPR